MVNASKRGSFSAVCSRKVSSTTNPRAASRAAGSSSRRRLRLPHRSSAVSQVASVPGTPTDRPLVTSSAKVNPSKAVRGIDSGAVSRPSIVVTRPLAAL